MMPFGARCEALEMTPPQAIGPLAMIHDGLGLVYHVAGDLDRALFHFREAIRLHEAESNSYGAAKNRCNFASALAQAGRFTDARQYAEAALRDYETYGAGAADDVLRTLELISRIAKAATA